MNIFYIHDNPVIAAAAMTNKHVVKMILESAQLLSTAHRYLDGQEYIKISKSGARRDARAVHRLQGLRARARAPLRRVRRRAWLRVRGRMLRCDRRRVCCGPRAAKARDGRAAAQAARGASAADAGRRGRSRRPGRCGRWSDGRDAGSVSDGLGRRRWRWKWRRWERW